MNKLTSIGCRTGTDKAFYHKFTDIYEELVFSKYTSPRILEIGVASFSSIQMYLDYFDCPDIVAMDIDNKSQYLSDKWKFIQGDQSKITDLEKCINGENYDIIIDDGGHTMKQQQVSFGYLIDFVKPGGYYILEDLHTSFRQSFIEKDCEHTSYDMLITIQQGKLGFSNYIDLAQQQRILDKIESVVIWAKNPNDLTDSVTSIIKIK